MKIRTYFNRIRVLKTKDYKSVFDFKTGYFLSFNKKKYSPLGPETLEVEIAKGNCPHRCKFCYRYNQNEESKNMSLTEFKTLIDKIPPTLTQISLGVTGIQTNPDTESIIDYCISKRIKPNITITGIDLTDEFAQRVVPKLGGIGISVYENKVELAFQTLERIKRYGHKQVGFQMIVAKETLEFTYQVINRFLASGTKIKPDHLVLITPKPVKGSEFTLLDKDEYRNLLKYCLHNKINVGLDQCSKPRLIKVISDRLINNIDSCECSFFTAFIDVYGNYWHCGFSEISDKKIHDKMNVFEVKKFEEIWESETLQKLRNDITSKEDDECRLCPLFDSINHYSDKEFTKNC